MTDWQDYPRKRKISYRDGYVVIVPGDFNLNKIGMKLFCDVCQIRFGSKEDEKTYKLFGCCSTCANEWAYSNKNEWQNGWRPDADKIKKSVEKRFFANPIIVFE